MMAIPQIWEIYVMHNTAGVSVLTWGMMATFNIPWLIYGIVHKAKPLIVAYSLWFIVNSTITIGILIAP